MKTFTNQAFTEKLNADADATLPKGDTVPLLRRNQRQVQQQKSQRTGINHMNVDSVDFYNIPNIFSNALRTHYAYDV